MNFAIIGTGYVADFYLTTLPWHPSLKLVGVFDRNPERAAVVAAKHGVRHYESLEAVLADEAVTILVNLTPPDAHYAINHAALSAGKHVYCEKPLAMSVEHSAALVELASRQGLYLSCAPCSLLSETAQSIWREIRNGAIGKPRLVYAELDDGVIHRMAPDTWRSESGWPWPWEDEFETGCTIEHAAYVTSWLVAFFGPAVSVSGYSNQLVNEKLGVPQSHGAADFSVGCIEFASGVVARLTNSIIAPRHRAMMIVGESAYITLDEVWHYREPYQVRQHHGLNGPRKARPRSLRERLKRAGPVRQMTPARAPVEPGAPAQDLPMMDFCRGISELAAAIEGSQPLRLTAALGHHLTELSLALEALGSPGSVTRIQSTFDPIAPMPWAQ